ncbi:hypothetical protein [Sorangium sp. So ce1000]|uniref:hypothetical protein n=1 Tax=Sorangium sp. So ce1000 TaxID=3133325 RepID=UPI003F62AEDF
MLDLVARGLMRSWIAMATAALVGVQACGVPQEPSDADRDGTEDVEATPESFYVGLNPATTAESTIPQILKAGRPQLAAACADRPEASIRIFNPVDPGAYEDVSCASILYGSAAADEASYEPIGEVQQGIGPISFLMCGLFATGSTVFLRYALCPRGRTERDRTRCNDTGLWGGVAMGVLCAVPL